MQSPTHRLPTLTALLVLSATTLLAQGGGPLQPEFTGSPVPPGPNVNEFTGDFTYGLPVMTVPGPYGSSYTISLSYRAGTNPNAEVGWVGYGWSLNPGSIVREKRGFPDDWSGSITYYNQQPRNYTVTASSIISAEVGSGDIFDDRYLATLGLSAGISPMKRYDSRTGYGDAFSVSAGASILGTYAGAQFMNDNGEGSWSPVLSPNLFMAAAVSSGYDVRPKKPGGPSNPPGNVLMNSLQRTGGRLLGSGGTPNIFRDREINLGPPAMLGFEGESSNRGWKIGISISPGIIIGADYGQSSNVLKTWTKSKVSKNAYGYLHSDLAESDDNGLMDFYFDRDVPYLLEDKFLPIPFSSADFFTVSGGGSFRAFNRNVGGFRQNAVSSNIDVNNFETTADGGAVWGVGARWGDGNIEYSAGAWKNPDALPRFRFDTTGDEPWFFRYSNDMGGNLLYDNTDAPRSAAIVSDGSILTQVIDFLGINDKERFPILDPNIGLQLPEWDRPGRNGYIGFTTNGEMELRNNAKYYRSYSKDDFSRIWVRDRSAYADQIGEFALFGEGGSRYVYGLPVFVRNEKSLQLGLRNIKIDSAGNVHHNTLAYSYTDESRASTALGQEMTDPYAVAWLLTEVTTPDYVDLTGDGPSNDDLGGWTRFRYDRAEGNDYKVGSGITSWGYWRQPMRGLAYSVGEISDPEDDLGGYSEGLRERYYLSRIETKTHVAVFVRNDYREESRKDNYQETGVFLDRLEAGDSTRTPAYYLANDVQRVNHARYLDRIELYTKKSNGALDSLLSTVYFEYDYSLRPNMPNSLPVHPDSTTRYGMLTLRKVWAESHNVRNAVIHPTFFGYDYRTSEDYSTEMQARYPDITSYADSLTAEMQNPDYTPYDLDAWGYYHPGGAERLDRFFPYVPQNTSEYWDPAAWQLKWIRSPLGGELRIQYEEDDYAFVHDKPAMAMVSLVEVAGGGFEQESYDQELSNKYYLRLSDIGVDSTDFTQVQKIRESIEEVESGKLMFRFLYALKGETAGVTDPVYNSEYLQGYADINQVGVDVVVSGGADTSYALYVRLRGDNTEHGTPRQLCYDFVRKRKRGKLGPNEGVDYLSEDHEMVGMLKSRHPDFNKGDYCKDLDYDHSYIRIPMITPKRGGGLRVKRLLSYDPGLEGDSILFGAEYHYEQYDQERNEVLSSGVAANEPGLIRDENALVDFLKREAGEELEGKVLSGRDRDRNEGPIGESLLPSASIGYSRVAVHPIHQGASATGFSVKDFWTYRDFPYDVRYDGLGKAIDYTDVRSDDYKTFPLFENLLIYRQTEFLMYLTQGYRFILNNMHGRQRRTLANGRAYTPYPDNWLTSASMEYLYYQPGDSIPLLYRAGDSIRYGTLGKTMEIVHATRKNGSYLDDFKIEGDAGFFFLCGMPYVAVNNTEVNTHVTSKVIYYPSIVKGVLSYADGNYNYEENIAFDPGSGAPLITRSRDGFDGLELAMGAGAHVGIYNAYSLPVDETIPEFGQTAGNEGALIRLEGDHPIRKGIQSGRYYIDFPGGSEMTWLRKLGRGDLLELTILPDTEVEPLAGAGVYHVDEVDGNIVWLFPSDNYNDSPAELDTLGPVFVEVIGSGRENVPAATYGNVVTYGETPEEVAVASGMNRTGGDIAARQALVDTLNAFLLAGSGTLDSTTIDPGLKVRHYTTGTCTTVGILGESWSFTTAGSVDTIFITMSSYGDTIVVGDEGGWFSLDNTGQIVYRNVGLNDRSQRVLNFTFCTDDPPLLTMGGVIAASAGEFSDTVDWDGGGVAYAGVGNPNPFETGERGRWSHRRSWVYRTDVKPSSDPVAGDWIHDDGGVWNDFSFFNPGDPSTSDTTKWFSPGEITGINRHNVPYKGVDMLGRTSFTVFDYGDDGELLPVYSVWNAEENSAAFESFEMYAVGDFGGEISDNPVHAGKKSLMVVPGDTTECTVAIVASQQVLEKGAYVRLWIKPDPVNGTVGIVGDIPPASTTFFFTERARAGDWVLHDQVLSTTYLDDRYDVGDTIFFSLFNLGTDTVWVDDIKLQPYDAVVTGTVYDSATYRIAAVFDEDNFGLYPGFNAEGRPYFSKIETARGVRTAGDAYGYIPGVERDWLGDGDPYPTYPTSTGSQEGSGLQNGISTLNDVDLLNISAGLEHSTFTIVGTSPETLDDLVKKKSGKFSELRPEQLARLDHYRQLAEEYKQLLKERKEVGTEEERQKIERRMESVRNEGDAVLEELGIDPESFETDK